MIAVRTASADDWEAIWEILHDVFNGGDTYPHPPETTRQTAERYWMNDPTATYVGVLNGEVVGSYYLKPNQTGLGSHVANAGYVVKPTKRGQGIGALLGNHSLVQAKALGFRAMQFNLVVSTNTASMRLWEKLGFQCVGTLPGAFRHKDHGYVDAYIMYRLLG